MRTTPRLDAGGRGGVLANRPLHSISRSVTIMSVVILAQAISNEKTRDIEDAHQNKKTDSDNNIDYDSNDDDTMFVVAGASASASASCYQQY